MSPQGCVKAVTSWNFALSAELADAPQSFQQPAAAFGSHSRLNVGMLSQTMRNVVFRRILQRLAAEGTHGSQPARAICRQQSHAPRGCVSCSSSHSSACCLAAVFCVQAGRRLAVRVNARGQKLEYLWFDGQEGKESKVRPCSISSSFSCSIGSYVFIQLRCRPCAGHRAFWGSRAVGQQQAVTGSYGPYCCQQHPPTQGWDTAQHLHSVCHSPIPCIKCSPIVFGICRA